MKKKESTKTLKNSFYYLSAFLVLALIVLGCLKNKEQSNATELVDYVDPFIGTYKEGHTFPGACLPFGMVQLSPDNGYRGVKAYNYAKTSILGFSHTHLSGTGPYTLTNYNNILVMPVVGELKTFPATLKDPDDVAKRNLENRLDELSVEEQQKMERMPADERKKKISLLLKEEKQKAKDNLAKAGYDPTKPVKGYESGYSHDEEEASPGYYAVSLKDYNVKAEMTTTMRAGFHRYTFPETQNGHIIIDVTHSITPGREAWVKILNNRQVEGYIVGDMEDNHSRPLKCYFFAEFNKAFSSSGTWNGEEVRHGVNESSGTNRVGAFVNYSTSAGEQILLKVGISYVSIEGAKNNLNTEIPDWDFDRIRNEARNIWNKKLNKIAVKGGTEGQKTSLYTSVYHSLMFPRTFSDVDGSYYSHFDNTIHKTNGRPYYVDFSLWDTYRAQHPLMTYLEPERQNEMINTFLDMYDQGGRLPLYVSYKNYYMKVMIGDHATSVIADSYRKGLRDYDIEKAYAAMRKNAMKSGAKENSRTGLDYYINLGYLPADKVRESVSVTLEYSYDDWCLAEMAKALGKKGDYLAFSKRARSYENLYDASRGLMRPKKADGSWLEMCDELPTIIKTEGHQYYSCFDPLWVGVSPSRHYTESNAWQYLWHIPHDIQGLINLMGSREEFCNKLDTLFTMTPDETGPEYAPLYSKIGQYVHGNEPVHHVGYLYNYAGQPWKTQMRIHQIMKQKYLAAPDGLCGNDDMGQMSAWYIFSAMGFYPVAPAQNVYAIGTPLFEELTLDLGAYYGGKKFTVKAKGVSEDNFYIQSATLNGKAYTKTYISHDDIANGGTLVFEMGPTPNNQWGIHPEDAPPSMSDNYE
ncbi:GH92 family glycosyl hydrolase [Prolixibacteraceae bacterium Z1-6]|uniref:GH92 family glycosyl hydrolase n=1 Tax=Draconibacterium aestuarii TaxID=2998507 RepID=A0A9X3FAG7_9BACT|nr:GH92 family glycosyl hydrolase [Prolixibacteraceae bacterium Z1-6]